MREPSFWILTALATGPQYGYGIITEVARLSDGSFDLHLGSLYTVIDRLVALGLVEADHEEVVDGRNRRYYRLTDKGDAALAEAVSRLRLTLDASAAQLAGRRRLGLGNAFGAAW